MFSSVSFVPGECTVCGGQNGNHYPWCGHAARILSGCPFGGNCNPQSSCACNPRVSATAPRPVAMGGCPGGQHYFVNQGGTWTCTMCGETR